MTIADRQLLERWQAGEAEAFQEIVRRYSGLVFRAGRRVLGDEQLAEDVTQDCFLTLLSSETRPVAPLAAWLHRVATNRALSVLRSEKRREAREARRALPEADVRDPTWREARCRIDQEIEALPDEQRVPLIKSLLEGETHEEIAHALGVPRRTVSHRIQQGIERVRSQLNRAGIGLSAAALVSGLAGESQASPSVGTIAELGRMAIGGPGLLEGSGRPSTPARRARPAAISLAGLGVVLIAAAWYWFSSNDGSGPVGQSDPERLEPQRSGAIFAAGPQAPPEEATRLVTESAGRSQESPSRLEAAPPSGEGRAVPKGLTVRGTIRDSQGTGIPSAEVLLRVSEAKPEWGMLQPDRILRSDVLRTRCDAAGAFELSGVRVAGQGELTAFQEGFAGARETIELAGEHVESCDLVLGSGKTFRGRILDGAGHPLPESVVAILEANDASEYTFGWGYGLTNVDGWFELGLVEAATHATVRVNSEVAGQEIFAGVPVDEPAILSYRARATLKGRVSGERGEASLVRISGELPEPQLAVFYTGWRLRLEFETEIGEDGSYLLEDVQPGIAYDVAVVEPGERVHGHPLSPPLLREDVAWSPQPGEVRVWSPVVEAPPSVSGVVRTRSGLPAAGLPVQVDRDGQTLWDHFAESDSDGRFQLRISAGAGRYRFSVMTRAGSGVSLASEELTLSAGESREIELEVPDPLVLALRVLDASGEPVESIQLRLLLESPGKPRTEVGRSAQLDADGRTRIELFDETTSVEVKVAEFPDGAWARPVRLSRADPQPFDEIVFRLSPAIGVRGRIVDVQGLPVEAPLSLRVTYSDGEHDDLNVSSSKTGSFERKAGIRAGVTRVRIDCEQGSWIGDVSDVGAEAFLDLGEIMIR